MKSIDAAAFRRMLVCAANTLEAERHTVDDMNVFPVPDGDTGTNMSHTLTNALKEVLATQSDEVGEIADALSRGALRGARGNSGVILSQLLRGMAKSLKGAKEMDVIELAQAINSGVEKAFKAVMKPKEGTILTVARAMADEAMGLSVTEDEVEEMLQKVLAAGEAMLARTPDMLPVLKEAGVVDAGGQGLVFIYQGMLRALTDKDAECEKLIAQTEAQAPEEEKRQGPAQTVFSTESITYAYCTEFIAEKVKDAEAIEDEIRAFLSEIGDSLVVVTDGDLLKVHVHTNDPGLVIRKATSLGELTSVKIENMRLQHQNILDLAAENAKEPEKPGEPEIPAGPRKEYGFVAVTPGPGLEEVFRGLGTDCCVTGGQTMNPSTEDIIEAAEKVNADVVYVLPNNKNIILAAAQAAEMVEDKRLIVIPSKSVSMGVTALLNFVPSPDPEAAADEMTDAMENVTDGQITFAVRDTVMNGFKIKENDILAMKNGELTVTGRDLKKTAQKLLESMIGPDSFYMTLYYGADVTEEDAEALAEYARKKHPQMDVTVVNGGQPLYYYLISVE